MKVIDINDLEKSTKTLCVPSVTAYGTVATKEIGDIILLQDVKSLPTIDIVYCRDCKYCYRGLWGY